MKFLWSATGRVPVVLDGVQWKLSGEEIFTKDVPCQPLAQAFLARHRKTWDDNLKIVERRLEPGGEVYVLGTLAEAQDAARGSLARRRAGIAGLFEAMLPKSWQERRAAWAAEKAMLSFGHGSEAAVADAVQTVARSHAPIADAAAGALLPRGLDPHRIVVYRGARGEPFIVSNGSEERLTDSLSHSARWGMGVGAALIVIGVADLVFG